MAGLHAAFGEPRSDGGDDERILVVAARGQWCQQPGVLDFAEHLPAEAGLHQQFLAAVGLPLVGGRECRCGELRDPVP